MQTVPGSAERSGHPRSLDGEAKLVQLSSIASPSNLQSGTDTPLAPLDETELLPLLGIKAETVEALPIATYPPINQSTTDTVLDPLDESQSEELPLTLQQREAISRRHHLKFITGHYGSGKVTVSYNQC